MRSVWSLMFAAMFASSMGVSAVLADSAPEPPKKEEPKKEEPKKEEPKAEETISLPWTADEIKKGVKKGMMMLFKVEQTRGEQKITEYQKIEITAVTDETYTQRQSRMDAEKKEVGKAKESTKKWSEYMGNMKFSKAGTTVTEEKLTLAGVEWDCKVYTRTESTTRGDSTTKYWFPKDKAGTLVKMTFEGGGMGQTMTLEEFKAGE